VAAIWAVSSAVIAGASDPYMFMTAAEIAASSRGENRALSAYRHPNEISTDPFAFYDLTVIAHCHLIWQEPCDWPGAFYGKAMNLSAQGGGHPE
jgi:hypothetical protein